MRILVTGSAGRLGAALCRGFAAAGQQVVGLTRHDLDVTRANDVATVVGRARPDAIVNCAGYNAVDAAEADVAAAFDNNARAPGFLARAADRCGALLVHYSTDFVFDGVTDQPYGEDAPTNPLSVYGASKLAGEEEVRTARRHYILRVESLFGGAPRNGHSATVDYLIQSLAGGARVRAFVDRTATPSYVPDVVAATFALIDRQPAYGTYHCVNSGSTTWYALAMEIAVRLGVSTPVEPSITHQMQAPARRPRFCALSNRKLLAAGIPMPDWRSAIGRHLDTRTAQPAEHVAHSRP